MEFFEKMKRVKEEVEETLGDRKSTEDFKYSDFWDQQHWGKETEFRKKLKEFLKKAEELDKPGGAATTVINIYEAMHGVYRMKTRRKQRLTSLQRLITNLEIFDLTIEATTTRQES